ncbi:MAG: MBL fold metallo-hydrolase, partial [Deltaproteobacteria bacterium]|nr:MBL fold metallo-hydrolase [Deltaproteobacteria bacterium]
MTQRWTLHRSITLSVLASVRSEAARGQDVGCSIQGPVTAALRRAQTPLRREVRRLGERAALEQAAALIRALEETPRYRALTVPRGRRGGRRHLRPEVLFPSPARHAPRFLHVQTEGAGLDLPVPRGAWPHVQDFLSALAGGMSVREAARFPTFLQELLGELRAAGLLAPWAGPVQLDAPGVFFAGHHMARVDTGGARLLVDPWFRGMSAVDLPSYPPVQAQDVGPVDAVLITHTHGDHFHLGSLLQLPRSTRVLVPAVVRESLFSTDAAARLRQAGFAHVEPMPWWSSTRVGDAEITALPFHGEQPTDGEGVYPGLFNEGNTWLVRSPAFSSAFAA